MRALDGAKGLFLVVPPSFTTNDDKEYYLQFTRPFCRAIVSQRVKRVVSVSGVGRRVGVQAGPVTASFAKDAEIEKTGVEFRALWCPSFMENMLRAIPSLKQHCMFSNSRPTGREERPLSLHETSASSGAKLPSTDRGQVRADSATLGPEDRPSMTWRTL